MKVKKSVCAVIVMMIMLSVILTACNKNIKSTTEIDVSGSLGYDEATFAAQMATPKDIALFVNGSTDYAIVVPNDYSEELKYGAEYMRDCLIQMLGSNIEVVKEGAYTGSKFISLGDTTASSGIDLSVIEYDGYVVKTIGNNIFIKGNIDKATVNGIFGFLEDELGCMFVRDDFDYIPRLKTVYLTEKDYVNNPDFLWRKAYQYEADLNKWHRRLRMVGEGSNDFGVDSQTAWGTWCHNVFQFVEPDRYFDEHPEYYALVNGERRIEVDGAETQLCLTNSDIYPIIKDKLQEFIDAKPDIDYWDFSINDNYNYCQCDECNAVYEKTGSQMGTMLPIINQLAKDFPTKTISTLAYIYNEKVPKGMSCEDNVNIVIAPIWSSQLYSYKFAGNDTSAKAAKNIEEWSEICKSIYIWDYVINFKHLLLPYPNYAVQRENLEFYKEHNVKSVFHQGSREVGNEQACMRTYILSKQLWDIDVDINALLAKYVTVTYGKGAVYVAEYLDIMHESVAKKANDLDLYDEPRWHAHDYLSKSNIAKYMKLINTAIAEEENFVIVERLEELKINILYAKMNEAGYDLVGKKAAFNEFIQLVEKHGITRPHEIAPPTMEDYISDIYPKRLEYETMILCVIIIVPIVGVALISVGAVFAVKYLRKRRKIK